MTRVHAFGDDALGEYDAVGLVAALKAGSVSIHDVVDAAIARAERVNPELNAIAHVAFDRARADAAAPRPGFFAVAGWSWLLTATTWHELPVQCSTRVASSSRRSWTPVPRWSSC